MVQREVLESELRRFMDKEFFAFEGYPNTLFVSAYRFADALIRYTNGLEPISSGQQEAKSAFIPSFITIDNHLTNGNIVLVQSLNEFFRKIGEGMVAPEGFRIAFYKDSVEEIEIKFIKDSSSEGILFHFSSQEGKEVSLPLKLNVSPLLEVNFEGSGGEFVNLPLSIGSGSGEIVSVIPPVFLLPDFLNVYLLGFSSGSSKDCLEMFTTIINERVKTGVSINNLGEEVSWN